jgi:hypothetical protein
MTYQRLVVELSHGDGDALRDAAEFARLLGIDLHGLFVEDESLFGLAGLPFAREFRPAGNGWTPLNPDRIEADLRHAAEAMRHRMTAIVRDMGVPNAFEVMRGDPAAVIAEQISGSDIIVIAEPAARIGLAFDRMLQAAAAAAGAVLLMPARRRRMRGPVVAIARDGNDPALSTAAAIAQASDEALHVYPDKDLPDALSGEQERIVVMTRDHNAAAAMDMAVARGVPVLLVEPAMEDGHG